jgi:hypothetical protein
LDRAWQVEGAGGVSGDVRIACGSITGLINSAANLRLLVDNDDVFTNATPVSGSYAGGVFTVAGRNLPDGTRYSLGELTSAATTYDIAATAGEHGTIMPSGTVSVISGGSTSFTITADANWHIDDVTTNDVSVGAVSSFTWSNVTANGAIHAAFEADPPPTGKVFYVSSASGDDSNAGTNPSAPCKTIQGAIGKAPPRSEFRIATVDVDTLPLLQSNVCAYTGSGAAVIALNGADSHTLKGGYIYFRDFGTWQPGVVPPVVNGQGARRGLYVTGDGGTSRVELLEFANGAAANGANVYAEGGGLQLVGTPIHGGAASGNGGGLYMKGVDFSVSMGSYSNLALPGFTGLLPIYSNSAAQGGGLYLDGGYPLLTTVGLLDNTASGDGGGMYIQGGYPSVVAGTLRGNVAAGDGGAIYVSNSVARVGGMIVTSNRADRGGAIFFDGPFALTMETATLIANNYIQNNTATGGKGGAFFFNSANIGIVNNIITGNDATDGAAAYLYASSPRFLENTIADNVGTTALYVRHNQGEGRWVVTPAIVNPLPPYNVILPAGSNWIAGIPIPSWPQMTNTIISGHTTAVYVEQAGNDLLANKVKMGYTLWHSNTTDIAGAGAAGVEHQHDVYADPRYTGKGTAPGVSLPYHIATNSAAVDAGTAVGLTLPGTDLLLDIDGQFRPSGKGMDIGADEVVTDPFSVWLVPPSISRTAAPGTTITNEHMLLNSGTQADIYDIAASNDMWSGSVSPAVVTLAAQTNAVITVVVNVPLDAQDGEENMTGISAVSRGDPTRAAAAADPTRVASEGAGGIVRYVWRNSVNPSAPYTSPDTAGHEIQTVVDVCSEGDTVIVYPGVHESGGRAAPGSSLTNRVCVTNAIIVQALGGASNTVIQGAEGTAGGNGPGAVRGLYLDGFGRVTGFRIVSGHTLTAGDAILERGAGGALVGSGGVLENGLVESCASHDAGGGAACLAGGTIRDTRVAWNRAGAGGGGVLLTDGALVDRCQVSDNLSTNAGDDGGGVFLSTGGTVRNCLTTGNVAQDNGGGLYAGPAAAGTTVENCTVVENSAGGNGGGLYVHNGEYANCIIVGNTAGGANANWRAAADDRLTYCDTVPKPTGAGCITNDPQFTDAAYHIGTASPCVDAGENRAGVTVDLDGALRPRDGDAQNGAATDMGCYEVYNANGDSDGDGMSDGGESVADTDSMDANDVLRITAISNNSPVTVYFKSSASRLYTVVGCSNLVVGVWTNVPGGGPMLGAGGADHMQDTNTPPRGPFYRLRVETQTP